MNVYYEYCDIFISFTDTKTKGDVKISMPKKFLASLVILLSLCSASHALDENLPERATLSANRMRFDAQTGDFLAEGDVRITAGELHVIAPLGTGNIERQEVNFERGITASGKWRGDKVDIKAGRLLLSFADIPGARFQNGVKGGIGTMYLDADRLTLTGLGGISTPSGNDRQTKFWLVNARSIEDRSRGITFGAGSVEGSLRRGELHEMTAKKGVWIKGRPKAKEAPVSLRGDSALYSVERGSVVVSGHVVAVQGGRTLKSDSIVYFPDQNRVEAIGGLTQKKNGEATTQRAEITIDLSRERKPAQVTKTESTNQTEQPKPKTQTRTQRTRRK